MKYYTIQIALNLNPITKSFVPVRKMRWYTPTFCDGVLWTNYEDANLERLYIQGELNHHAVRVKPIGFIKYLLMTINQEVTLM